MLYQSITPASYYATLIATPVIHLVYLDHLPVEEGYAVKEVWGHNDAGIILTCNFRKGSKFFSCKANIWHYGIEIDDYYPLLEGTDANEACSVDWNNDSHYSNNTLMDNYKEISEQQYLAWREVMPVIYFSSVDDVIISKGFAVSEAYDYNKDGVVVRIFFYVKEKYYTCYANLRRGGRYVGAEYSYLEFSSGNAARSVIPVCDELNAITS